jgi:hypothetical protein
MAQNKKEQKTLKETSQKQSIKGKQHKILMKNVLHTNLKSMSRIIAFISLASNSFIWKSIGSVLQKQINLNWVHFHPPTIVPF